MSDQLVPINALSRALSADPDTMGLPERLQIWSALDWMEKKAKKAKKAFRDSLMSYTRDNGEHDLSGSSHAQIVECDGGQVKVQTVERIKLDDRGVLYLLQEKGIHPNQGGSYTFKADQSKLDSLVRAGLLDAEDLDKCYQISSYERMTVKKPTAINEAVKAFESKLGVD